MKGFWKHGSTGINILIHEYQQIFLECQIHKLIELKYILPITIHYQK